jgi:hypothetical protein
MNRYIVISILIVVILLIIPMMFYLIPYLNPHEDTFEIEYTLKVNYNGTSNFTLILPFPVNAEGNPKLADSIDWGNIDHSFVEVNNITLNQITGNQGLQIKADSSFDLQGNKKRDKYIPDYKKLSLSAELILDNNEAGYTTEKIYWKSEPYLYTWVYSSSDNVSIYFSIYTDVQREHSGTTSEVFCGEVDNLVLLKKGWQVVEVDNAADHWEE